MIAFSAEASTSITDEQIRCAPQKEILDRSDAAVFSSSAFPSYPAWLTSAFSYLESLQQLKANWDGEKSPSPSWEIIHSVGAFLQNPIGQIGGMSPQIEPTRVGGILLSWQRGPHDLEVDFETPAGATFAYVNHDSGAMSTGILFGDNQPRSDHDMTFLEFIQRYFLAAE